MIRTAVGAFVLLYVLAVCTPFGQAAENSLIVGYADHARITAVLYSVGPPPLKAAWATLLLGMVLMATITVVRRRWLDGVAAGAVAVLTVGCTEVLAHFLPRPDISDAPQSLTAASFPSGHVAIVAGLSMGLVLIASPRTRPYVAALGALWLAVTGAAVQTLYWHRPSDVLGATLLAIVFGTLARRFASAPGVRRLEPAVPSRGLDAGSRTPVAESREPVAASRTAVAESRAPVAVGWQTLVVLAVCAGAAVLASSRTDAFARPLVFAAIALVCAGAFWTTSARTA